MTQPGEVVTIATRLRWRKLLLAAIILVGLLFSMILAGLPPIPSGEIVGRLQTLVTAFLGIFLEAVPFLLIGSLLAGLIHVFVDPDLLQRLFPRRVYLAVPAGALLGLLLPACECGVVPITRRLYQKGLPLSAGVTFLLATPIVNPIVIASTYTAFGWGSVLLARVGLGLLIAILIGFLFQLARPAEVLRPDALALWPSCHPHDTTFSNLKVGERVWEALATAGSDFLDMSRYLVIGALLSAGMQAFVPQSVLLAVGSDPWMSVMALLFLAFVLSICSTVDAFLALSFVNTFSLGAIVGFLVFGPMVDIKSSLMFLGLFRRKVVVYLILLPFLMSLLAGICLNLIAG